MTLLVKPRPQPDLGGTNATYICGRIVQVLRGRRLPPSLEHVVLKEQQPVTIVAELACPERLSHVGPT